MKVESKNNYKFMMFQVKGFHSLISKKLLDDSINFVRQHAQMKGENFNINHNSRKSLLYNKKILWQKKNNNLFNVAQWSWSLWNVRQLNLANKFDKNSVRLYRIDGLLWSKISIAIVQIKYVKNSTHYFRKTDYC